MPVWDPKANDLLSQALDCASAEDRGLFLDQACGADTELRARVEKMLAAQAEAGSFLESPAADLAATTDHRPLAERPGTVIGPYKLLQQIGEGGMGVVFMAEQTEPIQRTVALKIIKPGMDTRQVIARFEAERQAVAMMDHPNIAKVLDAGTTDSGRPYFVMELVKGVPITKYCDDKHLPLRDRLELFMQVCQAVQHAHQKGIIHRDIKPNNVLVAEYDNRAVPKVIDFGVAKATAQRLTERTMFTEFGQVLGTMEYMSPEQSKFNQLDIDTRSDIYSLGVLLYELLAGSTPFEGKRLHAAAFDEMLRIIREEEPQKPSTRLSSIDTLPSVAVNRGVEPLKLNRLVRGELDWIVMKALEKDRNRRYETATGFAADIERHLHDEPVEAGPPSAMYRFRKFAMRNKAGLLTAALLVLMLVLGTVISTWQALRAHRAERIAQTRLASETAVSGFLQEMLASANPETLKGSEYTVHQLLDDFSAGLGNQLAGQPEVEATVRGVIGKAYWRMGMSGRANPHLKAALDLRRRVLPPDDTRIADSLLDYALNLSQLNISSNNPTAESYAREALRIYQTQKAGPGAVLHALWALQQFVNRQERPAEAAAIADEALAIAGDLDKTPYPDVANILHELARIKSGEGKQAEAENLARKSVALHRRLHGDNHPETAWGLRSLGLVLAAEKKYPEAEAAYREALANFRYHYSNKHTSVGIALTGVKHALKAQGNEAGLAKLEQDERELSGTDLRVVITSLVWQLQTAPPWNARIDLAERAVTAAQHAPRAQREAIAAAILNHARLVFHWWEEYQPAMQLADLATQVYRPLAAEYPSEANQLGLADSLCLSGWAETKLGMFPQSELTLREALRVTNDAVAHFDKSRSLQQAIAHRLLGDALARQKSTKEAIGHCRTSLAITTALIGESQPQRVQVEQLVYARVCLADALASHGSLDAAAAEYRTALAAIEKASADFPNKIPVSEIAADCFERMARVLPGVAHESPAQSQLAHRLIGEAIEQFNKLHSTLDPKVWPARVPLAVGQKNVIVSLASDTAWAAEADQAEQGFRALSADWTKNIGNAGYAWLQLARSLPHDTRNLPRVESALRESIVLFERGVAESPTNVRWDLLAESELHLGRIYQERQKIKEAEAAFRRGIEVFEKNGGSPAQRAASYSALASWLAENGRTTEAIDYFNRAIKLNDQDAFAWQRLALLRLAAHDEAAYRQTCATLVEKSLPNNPQGRQASYIVWACFLLPDAGVDPAQVVRIAQAAVAANARDPDYLISLGASLYRAGRHEEAAKTLADAEAAYQHEQTTPTPGIYVHRTITYCHLFLAMTHQRLDHHDDAKGWLKKAVAEIDELAKAPRAADYPWYRRLALEVLRKEAESLISRVPTKDHKEDAAKTPG